MNDKYTSIRLEPPCLEEEIKTNHIIQMYSPFSAHAFVAFFFFFKQLIGKEF